MLGIKDGKRDDGEDLIGSGQMTSKNGANKTYRAYNLTRIAQERGLWKQMIKFAVDT